MLTLRRIPISSWSLQATPAVSLLSLNPQLWRLVSQLLLLSPIRRVLELWLDSPGYPALDLSSPGQGARLLLRRRQTLGARRSQVTPLPISRRKQPSPSLSLRARSYRTISCPLSP